MVPSAAVVSVAVAAATIAPAAACQPDLAALLPEETVATVELSDAGATWAAARAAVGQPAGAAGAALRLLDVGAALVVGGPPAEVLGRLAPRAAMLAVIAAPAPAPLILIDVAREPEVEDVLARFGALAFAWHGDVLALSPREDVLERWRRQAVRSERDSTPPPVPLPSTGLRLWLDVARARAGKPALWEQLDPGGRFLIGPLAAAIDGARELWATVEFDAEGEVRLTARLDGAAAPPASLVLARPREVRALPPAPADWLAMLALDRSLRGYLAHLDRLLPEAAALQAKGGLANLDVLIGGASFADDVLAFVAEPMTLLAVAAPVRGDDDLGDDPAPPEPRLRLPGFALVAEVRDAGARRLLTKGFHRFGLVLAAQRVQGKLPPVVPQRRRLQDRVVHVLDGPPWRGLGDPPTSLGVHAALTFARDFAVLATTPECALAVADAIEHGTGARARGDCLRLSGPAAARFVRDNLHVLATGRALDEGGTLAAAERFFTVAADLFGHVAEAEVEAAVVDGGGATELRLSLRRAKR